MIEIERGSVRCELDTRRGLAIRSLGFAASDGAPLLGTIPHGAFDEIDWAADFYSGHLVVEVPARGKVTDLERVAATVCERADHVEVAATIATSLGGLPERVRVFDDRVELSYGLSHWGERPIGSIRAAFVTLLPDAWGETLYVTCANGGAPERLRLDGDFDHGAAVSSLVSARAAFGATDGCITIDDGRVALELAWRPERIAALPLLSCRRIGSRRFVRLALSLGELDETLVAGAPLRDLDVTLRARRIA